MRSFFRNEDGNVLAFTAVAFFTLLMFAAMVTDFGYIFTARNQLQNAVDAAALAGGSGLLVSRNYASAMAVRYAAQNDCIQQAVAIGAENIAFPASNQIRVNASRTLPLFFLRLIGINSHVVTAVATAELGYVTSTNGLAPWAVPRENWNPGDRVTIKAGHLGEVGTNPSFFYPVDFPPVNRGDPITGASEYEYNIVHGCQATVEIGDILQVEPGVMQGPTGQGVRAILAMDDGAYWDGSGISNSSYPEFSSPRIVKIPLYDPAKAPDSGRNTITVIGFAAFLVEAMQGKDVEGVFLEITSPGSAGSGYSLLRCVHLI